MKTNLIHPLKNHAGYLLAGVLGLGLAGCVVAGSPPPPTYGEAPVMDDYVYYPGYEVYYSNVHHQYVYRDGNEWVTRSSPPPNIQVNVLRAAPSVHMDFHDHPWLHHDQVQRTYPRNWRPPPSGQAEHHDRDYDHH